MEKLLSPSEKTFQIILEGVDDLLWVLDSQGRFLYLNQAAACHLGKAKEELLGKTLWREFPHVVGTEFHNLCREAMCDQTPAHFQTLSILPPERWLEVHVYPSSEGLLIYSRDISAQKQLEREVGQAQDKVAGHTQELERHVAERTAELRDTIQSLESLCYNIAHDLRAPLRAMQGLTTALLEEHGEQLDEVGRDYATRIVIAAGKMDQLIHDLLAYGKLSRIEFPRGNVDLESSLQSVMARLQEEIKSSKAGVAVQRPLPQVWANPTLLEQIFLNLLSNAVKFVVPSQAPQISIFAEEKGSTVRVWLVDNGLGIDPAHHERIFQIFERVYTDDAYPGTGIGLAIVRKSAERLQGSAGVESELGQGSRFWVELPAARPQEDAERDQTNHTAGKGGLPIQKAHPGTPR